jgi:DNA-binding NarL/FixJ family response regulator
MIRGREGSTATPHEAGIASDFALGAETRPQGGSSRWPRPKWRVLVIEEDVDARNKVMALINDQPDLVGCGQGENLASARTAVAVYKPDLLVVNPLLANGIRTELTGSLRAEFPGLRMLVLSEGDEKIYAEKALEAGANGYVMKQEPEQEVLAAIRTVLSDKIYLGYSLSLKIIQRLLEQGATERGPNARRRR